MDKLGESCLGIREWYSPQDGQKILADIVAVHGLAANPYWTWVGKPKKTTGQRAPRMPADQEDPQSVIWLQELLPHRLPNCRILAFGYRSDYLIKAPKRDIANCAQELLVALLNNRTGPCAGRPLIFLGHSFGGIVIKEALVKATLAARSFGDIRRSTQGVVFLGTPHYGSSAAAYGEMLVAAAQAIGTGSNRELLRSLRKMSPELMKLASNFNDMFEDFEVFCFYEGLPTKLSSVIVTKDSAVIPNRLNDILIADHSGLNKFHDSNDPNFDKVAKALSNMVRTIAGPNEAQSVPAGTHIVATKNKDYVNEASDIAVLPARPWELAALLASRIFYRFAHILEQLGHAQGRANGLISSIAVQKCFFESWAYRVGLLPLLESRLPLHELFSSTAAARNICGLMQQVLTSFDMINAGKDSIDAPEMFRLLQENILALSNLFPEIKGSAQENVLLFSLLQQDVHMSQTDRHPVAEPVQRIEVMAAMKRINLLMEKSDARRDSSSRLIIKIGKELKIDVSKSPFRSTGQCSFKNDSGVPVRRQVLVEWKRYEGVWDTEIGNLLFHRVELLTEFLRTASRRPSPVNACVLECLGYCHNEETHRIGFVFAIPPSVQDRRSYSRLNRLLQQWQDSGSLPPSVDDRVRLAHRLTRALFDFHMGEWYHKAFNSFNILLFSEAKADDEDASEPFDAEKYTILSPYVVGFSNSRPDGVAEFSDPAQFPDEYWKYQHPDYKNVPNQKYRHEFDYYSLGIVLLEIGQWKPLSLMMHGSMNLDSHTFADAVLERRCPELRSFVGETYERIVSDLLLAFQEERVDLDQNELLGIETRFQFQTNILEAFESGFSSLI